ncbi:MAG TPA: GxxExxY protein [Rudaea sp.]|nr:GxxExxY protein [Rudaea sp.]HSC12722.1 GxxExxY protein [Rhodanobacteraceae bacterium]
MNADKSELIDGDLTESVIGVFYSVYNELGHGFAETVYENAFALALRAIGHAVEQQRRLIVRYRGVIVGEFFADLIVEERLLIELKTVSNIVPAHEAQLTNYLKATGLQVGLLLNFGPRAQFMRRVFDPALSALIRDHPRQSALKNSR